VHTRGRASQSRRFSNVAELRDGKTYARILPRWPFPAPVPAFSWSSEIPVIVVTGVDPKPHLPHALVVLCKPCDPDHIAKIVADHLAAAR